MPPKPDISRTTFALSILGLVIAFGALMIGGFFYSLSRVQYPPDRPLTAMERHECATSERKGWPLGEFCRYR